MEIGLTVPRATAICRDLRFFAHGFNTDVEMNARSTHRVFADPVAPSSDVFVLHHSSVEYFLREAC